MFLDDLKTYLAANGFANIYRDTLPATDDAPDDAIGLFVYSHTAPSINDGSGTRRVQIQVRREDPDAAYTDAHNIIQLLDSGTDEIIIHLTPERWCIARPLTFPRKLEVYIGGLTIYYIEAALWGGNEL